MSKPLTFEEVDNWPALGPHTLDPQRVRNLLLEVNGQTKRADMAEVRLAAVLGQRDDLLAALKRLVEEWPDTRERPEFVLEAEDAIAEATT